MESKHQLKKVFILFAILGIAGFFVWQAIAGWTINSGTTSTISLNKQQTNLLTNGLVGYWTFDGQDMDWSQNQATDKSGQSNHGTMVNMSTSTSPAPGKVGSALKFDGVDDYVKITDNTTFDFGGGDFTVGLWINFQSFNPSGEDFNNLIWRGDTENPIDTTIQADYKKTAQQIRLIAYDSSGNYDISAQSINLDVSTWYNMVFQRSSGNLKIFINNVQIGSDVASTRTLNATADNFYITVRPLTAGGSDRETNAILDEVRIYDRALSAGEVNELYKAGAGRMFVQAAPMSDFYAPLTSNLTVTRGSGSLTFARASSDWGCESTAGALSTITSGTPCYQAGSKGIKLEGARTNILNYGEALNSWAINGASFSTNSTVAPDGNTTADTVIDDSSGNWESAYMTQSGLSASTAYSGSVFIKRPVNSYTQMGGQMYFYLGSGHTSMVAPWIMATDNICSLPDRVSFFNDNWMRANSYGVHGSGGTYYITLYPSYFDIGSCGGGSATYTGSHVYWGATLEVGNFASSYISTGTGTTDITRAYTSLYGNVTNIATNNSTICVDVTPYHNASIYGNTNLLLLDSRVDDNNRTQIYWDGTNDQYVFNKRISGTDYDATISASIVKDTTNRICGRLSSTAGVDVWVDGIKGTGDIDTTNAQLDGSNFYLGSDESSVGSAWGYIKNVATWKTALTDAQMEMVSKPGYNF